MAQDESPVAARYAEALFELGVERDEFEQLGAALQEAARVFGESDELRQVLLNPAIELDERQAVIDAICDEAGWPKLFRNFVKLLVDRDRIRHIGGIAGAYARRQDAHLGRARARVTTAVELSDDQKQTLKQRLGALTGKDVMMTTDVDDELIGGAVARIGSTVYDGSVKNHLQRMREAILKEV